MSPPSYRPPGGGAAGLETDEAASYPRFVQKKGESCMSTIIFFIFWVVKIFANAKTPLIAVIFG